MSAAAAAALGPPPLLVDAQYWNNIAATPPDFMLMAGVFGLTLHAGTWGTGAVLKRYNTLGDAYVAMGAAITADGYAEYHCPSGQYQLTMTGMSGVTGSIEKIGQWGG
jgi:hypothetical protein